MASLFPETTNPVHRDRILIPLMTAAINMSGTAVLDFARALFGAETAEKALEARKEEMLGDDVNGGHGEGYSCRSLMRAYVVLEGGQGHNAKELMKIAKSYFPADVVEGELAVVKVESGM